MKVCVYGRGHLADATRTVCEMRNIDLTPATQCEIFWCCIDMPVSDNDESYVDDFIAEFVEAIALVPPRAIHLVSTQVPVGTLARLEKMYPIRHFATQPENIRGAHAVADMQFQNRVVVGTRHEADKPKLHDLFYNNFTPGEVHFMSPESAECTKHAINAFLAMEIAFINEISDFCQIVGADPHDVSLGLRTDRRTGSGPLKPGDGYRGGTLGRDVVTINKYTVGPVLSAIKPSNDCRLARIDEGITA